MNSYKSIINERLIILIIAGLIAALWFANQIAWWSALLLQGVITILLLQLDVKRRMDAILIRNKSRVLANQNAASGIQSVRTAALNSLPTPVLIIDRDHKILLANEASRTLLGEDIVGEDAFLWLRQPNTIQAVKRAVGTGRVDRSGLDDGTDLRFKTTDDRDFDLTLAPIQDDEDEDGYQVIVFFYEVTTLLQSEQMRVDFVANASHELRTPLSSLIGFIETLQGPAASDQEAQVRFLGIMQREAERMIRLIDDLLSLSRIEMSRHKPPQDVVDIQLAVRNSINAAQPIADKRGVKFELDLDDSASFVTADDDQITQVLLNLLVNDAKYVDENTTVFVKTESSDLTDDLVLTIRDEGPGIAAEHLGRLTERFYRVDTARSRKMGGTGLGLAIVKHILLRHKSQLEIKSRYGEGTQFSFRLPLAEPKNTSALSSNCHKTSVGADQL